MTQHLCQPDHGVIIMAFCFGGMIGLLAGKLLSDAEHRKPPS